jgi:hypothetical protein
MSMSFAGHAQFANYHFETSADESSDYVLYYSINKHDNFKTIFTTIYEINSDELKLKHRRGNNLKTKKPWKNIQLYLDKSELDYIVNSKLIRKFPETHKKYYKSIRNRPVVTLYFSSPNAEIFIQWEGAKPPNKKIISSLLALKSQLTNVVDRKIAAL